ncbi:MAG: sigma-54 dependent transcriptional regulator [Pirellulales bacterium]|nr:sigma-54 dependent transcriptional regulator [Pirellulales bacterium]
MNSLSRASVDAIVGSSSWTEEIRETIVRVAAHSSNVLITGPSGTGKELIARAVHSHSPRVERPFIPADCAALPGTLFASQMFGHTKGAFTGAHSAAVGCFRAAEGGTIFLDEIGELDALLQANLLRVLQERRVTPLGSHEEIPIDVRVIAATNRDLAEEVRAGRFREDLYYRLNVVSLETQPLCDRPDDIRTLVEHMLEKMAIEHGLPHKEVSPAAMNLLLAYDWPGNVRELGNVLERAVVLNGDDVLDVSALPELAEAVLTRATPRRVDAPDDSQEAIGKTFHRHPSEDRCLTLDEIEQRHLEFVLGQNEDNISATARELRIDRRNLIRKIEKYGIEINARRGRPTKNPR